MVEEGHGVVSDVMMQPGEEGASFVCVGWKR